jgi:predicted HAD superfamily Cof-like phosphohydrolase
MSEISEQLREFHTAFKLHMQDELGLDDVPDDLLWLRFKLLAEEVNEYAEAALDRDLVKIADALADIVYVAYGTALTVGINLDKVIAEIHRSNMTKLDENGQALLRADGKVLKSHLYERPNIKAALGV